MSNNSRDLSADIQPICFLCGRTPDQIEEYREGIFWEVDHYKSPADYLRQEEGTYNRDTNTFACTDCYMKIGMPTAPSGWKAPARKSNP